jgi:hypothetical protein
MLAMLGDRLAVVPIGPTVASLPKADLHVHSEAELLAFTRNAIRAAFVSSERRA